jgi:hypothetical protein
MEMYLLGALEQESNQEDYWIPKKRLKQQAILEYKCQKME